jgi:hypothetical protein
LIKEHGLRTLDKDVFLALTGTCVGSGVPGGTQLDDKTWKMMETFLCVFIGELSSFSIDEAIDLAKRYGG